MKDITKEEIDELFTIFPKNYPVCDIFHLTYNCTLLSKEIFKYCKKNEYLYDLFFTKEDTKCQDIKALKFNFNKNRYNRLSRLYDFIFIEIDLDKIDKIDSFFIKLYPISKNGGQILIFVKNDYDTYKLNDKLTIHNYVAINSIKNIFKNYIVVSARKMHGWGNK